MSIKNNRLSEKMADAVHTLCPDVHNNEVSKIQMLLFLDFISKAAEAVAQMERVLIAEQSKSHLKKTQNDLPEGVVRLSDYRV